MGTLGQRDTSRKEKKDVPMSLSGLRNTEMSHSLRSLGTSLWLRGEVVCGKVGKMVISTKMDSLLEQLCYMIGRKGI